MQGAIKRLSPLIEEVPLVDGKSAFVQPRTLFYTLDGKKRRWDAVENHGSVGVVIYHTGKQAFLLVRQFRPAVYATAAREAAKVSVTVPWAPCRSSTPSSTPEPQPALNPAAGPDRHAG